MTTHTPAQRPGPTARGFWYDINPDDPSEGQDWHDTTTVTPTSLHVWIELIELGDGFGHQVRYIAFGPKGEQPWSGTKFTRGYDALAEATDALTARLKAETGWARVDIAIDFPSDLITHYRITQEA